MIRMKRLSVVILVFIMVLSVCSLVNATNSIVGNVNLVIDTELRDVLVNSNKDAQIPVDIWLYDTVSTIQLEQDVSSKTGVTKEQLINNNERNLSMEKVDEYIVTERAMYAERNSRQYEEILKDYSGVIALTETRSGKKIIF